MSKPITFEIIQDAVKQAVKPREPSAQIMSPQAYAFSLKVEELEQKLKIAVDALKNIKDCGCVSCPSNQNAQEALEELGSNRR